MDFTKRELHESLDELVDAVLDAIAALEDDDPEAALEILYDALGLAGEEESENPEAAEASG